MFQKEIKFISNKIIIEDNKDICPEPTKLNIPEWYKKLDHSVQLKTVKGCMPFLDTLTAGYILKMPIDYYVEHNVEIKGKKVTGMRSSAYHIDDEINLNYDGRQDFHPPEQLTGCPYLEKNKNLNFHKIMNPFIIKTPPGYSSLFLPPMNNTDDRFSIIPGIVDTDTYKLEVNFPIVFNGDKYESLKTTIKRGTPYVQVIPFKRDSWTMSIEEIKEKKNNLFNFYKYLLNNYKKISWSKKSWK
jgi:hypothetical protein